MTNRDDELSLPPSFLSLSLSLSLRSFFISVLLTDSAHPYPNRRARVSAISAII